MGLFSKIVIAAGIGIVNKIVDNKNEKEKHEAKLEASRIQLEKENAKLKQEEIRIKKEIEQLKLKENSKLLEMKHDYEMESIEAKSKITPFNSTIICSCCKKTISQTATFCGYCGTEVKIKVFCKNCGKELIENAVFCGYCGEKRE